MGTLLQGCSIYDKADLDKMSATPGDAFRANADSDNGGRSDSAEMMRRRMRKMQGRIRKT